MIVSKHMISKVLVTEMSTTIECVDSNHSTK